MDFIDELRALGEKVNRFKDQISTEEATKTAFVLPFFNALGYDVFNPTEVVAEYVADLGIKKGEKVDYCIMKEGVPIIIVECKHWGEDLNVHNSQLHRYFHVTKTRFGLLTNGIIYRFYTDLEESNKMDDKPFLEFAVTDIKDAMVAEVKKFHKSAFNINEILSSASELKYAKEIRNILASQLVNPDDEFVKFFVSQVYKGRVTSTIKEQFTQIVKKSFSSFISDQISDRLKSALDNERNSLAVIDDKAIIEPTVLENENKISTTEVELEGFFILKSILRSKIQSPRITFKDTQDYFAINLDDNSRKIICRLWLNGAKKYLGTFDESKKETRNVIESLDDIYIYSEILIETALRYE